MNTPTEDLFTCPNCKGYHFNIGVGGTFVCTNKHYRSEDDKGFGVYPCGWKGHLPSGKTTAIGATNTTPSQIQIRTAEQAREATEQAIRKQLQEELTVISTSVEMAIQLGRSDTFLVRKISSEAAEFLTKAGYRVGFKALAEGSDQTTISW